MQELLASAKPLCDDEQIQCLGYTNSKSGQYKRKSEHPQHLALPDITEAFGEVLTELPFRRNCPGFHMILRQTDKHERRQQKSNAHYGNGDLKAEGAVYESA